MAGRALGLWCSCSPYFSGGHYADVALAWRLLYAPYQLFSCASMGCLANSFRIVRTAPPAFRWSFGGVYLLLNCSGLAFVCSVS